MITNYQWLWLVLTIICGIYAADQHSRRYGAFWESQALPFRIRSRAAILMFIVFLFLTIVSILKNA
jgi:hypothetical protein